MTSSLFDSRCGLYSLATVNDSNFILPIDLSGASKIIIGRDPISGAEAGVVRRLEIFAGVSYSLATSPSVLSFMFGELLSL